MRILRPSPPVAPALALALALAAAALPSHATLGEAAATVEGDRMALRAARTVQAQPLFDVHELALANGTTVREYVSRSGEVFAVTWSGATNPDLRQLLGAARHDSVLASRNRLRAGHGHQRVQEGSLIVETGGRMRALRGRAYLSDRIPAGVGLDALR
jgi:hypothetical protein